MLCDEGRNSVGQRSPEEVKGDRVTPIGRVFFHMPPGFGRILCTEDMVKEALVNFGPTKPERRVVLLRAEELSQDEATESCFFSRLAENPSLGRFVSPKRQSRR